MFRVENADFIADKLAAELLPNQEFREVLRCSRSRRAPDWAESRTIGARIEFRRRLGLVRRTVAGTSSCADTGDGIRAPNLRNTHHARGSGSWPSPVSSRKPGHGIRSAPYSPQEGPHHPSMKSGERTMVQSGGTAQNTA